MRVVMCSTFPFMPIRTLNIHTLSVLQMNAAKAKDMGSTTTFHSPPKRMTRHISKHWIKRWSSFVNFSPIISLSQQAWIFTVQINWEPSKLPKKESPKSENELCHLMFLQSLSWREAMQTKCWEGILWHFWRTGGNNFSVRLLPGADQ